jgi:hypothetical protein
MLGVLELAAFMGVALRPEHVVEVAAAWGLMEPHRALVQAAALGPEDEPAALFRP